jgi:hypothetical protein
MKNKSEKIWLIVIVVFILIEIGLLTKFRFNESLDISRHDTYFVLSNVQVTIISSLLILIVYGLSYGGLILSRINKTLKHSTVILQTTLGIILVGFSILLVSDYIKSGLFPLNSIIIGLQILFIGLGFIMLIRSIEILKKY